MNGVSRTPPGELIYLSERKLLNLARAHGLSSAWIEREADVQVEGRLGVTLDPAAALSARARLKIQRIEPDRRERNIERLLARMVRRLAEGDGLAELDHGALEIMEGGWFHFRRPLRFGVGVDDDWRSVSALVLVDREAVEPDGVLPGLLMHGSPVHLRAPYRDEAIVDPYNRSGSGTGRLFRWAAAIDLALETEIETDVPALGDRLDEESHDRRSSEAPALMYEVFARDDWMSAPRFPQLVNTHFCEGVALASLLAAGDGRTIVMASPLYVRIGPAQPDLSELEQLLRPDRRIRALLRRRRK